MNKIPMTSDGYSKLKEELKKLTSEDRPNIIAAIAEARGHGDLSTMQSINTLKNNKVNRGRISDLESSISRAEVIDIKSISGNDVKFRLEIEDDDTRQKQNTKLLESMNQI